MQSSPMTHRLVLLLLAAVVTGSHAFAVCPATFQQQHNTIPTRMGSTLKTVLHSAVAADQRSFSGFGVTWDWQDVANSAFVNDERPIILFDGKCNLCNGGVNFALDHDPKATFRFVSLQSKVGQSLLIRSGRNPNDISSIVLCVKDGNAYFESDAILRIAQGLDGILPVIGGLGMVCPKLIRDSVYHVVAENRYRFGERESSCRMDYDGEFTDRFVQDP